jgi:hypothetical protein
LKYASKKALTDAGGIAKNNDYYTSFHSTIPYIPLPRRLADSFFLEAEEDISHFFKERIKRW